MVFAPSGKVADPDFEDVLHELGRCGYPIWRVKQTARPDVSHPAKGN